MFSCITCSLEQETTDPITESKTEIILPTPPSFLDNFVAISPDEKLIAVENNIWSIPKDKQLMSLNGGQFRMGQINDGFFLNENEAFLMKGAMGFTYWDLQNHQPKFSLSAMNYDLSFNGQLFAAVQTMPTIDMGSSGNVFSISKKVKELQESLEDPSAFTNTVSIGQSNNGKILKKLQIPIRMADFVYEVRILKNNDLIAVLTLHGDLFICNWKTEEIIKKISLFGDKNISPGYMSSPGSGGIFGNLCFHPEQKFFGAIKETTKLNIYDFDSNQLIQSLSTDEIYNTDYVNFTANGKYIYKIGNSSFQIWDVTSGKQMLNVTSPTSLRFSNDDKYLAISSRKSTGGQATSYIYKLESFKKVYTLEGATGLCFSPRNSNRIAYITSRGVTIRTFLEQIEQAKQIEQTPSPNPPINPAGNALYGFAFNLTKNQILIGDLNNIKILDWDKVELRTLPYFSGLNGIQMSLDQQYLAISHFLDQEFKIDVEDQQTKEKIRISGKGMLTGYKIGLRSKYILARVNFTKDNNTFDSHILIYDLKTGKQVQSFKAKSFDTYDINGDTIIQVLREPSQENTIITNEFKNPRTNNAGYHQIRLLNLKDKKPLLAFTGFHDFKQSVDGKTFCLSDSRSVKVYNSRNQRLLQTITLEIREGYQCILELSPDGKKIAILHLGQFRLYDIRSGKLIQQFQISANTAYLYIDPNWQNVAYFDAITNTIKLQDIITGEEKCRIVLWGEKDFVLITPDNYYMATRKGATQGVTFEQNGTLYDFSQFDLKFNRPDLVLQQLGYTSKKSLDVLHKAYLKRLHSLELKESSFQINTSPPEVKLVSDLPTFTSKSIIKVKFSIQNEFTALERINIFVNKVPLYGSKGLKINDKKRNYSHEVNIPLNPGKNTIEIEALNKTGVFSKQISHAINCEAKFSKPDLYLIAIGVSEYQNSEMNLSFAAKDAKDVLNLFADKKEEYNHIHKYALLNEEATESNLLELKTKLAKAKVHDQVIIFVAGHGLVNNDLDYFLATSGTNFNSPKSNSIPYETIETLIDGIPIRNKLVLIDACHSGEIDKENVSKTKGIKIGGEVKFRSFDVQMVSSSLEEEHSFNLMKRWFVDLNDRSGAVILASTSGIGVSIEGDQWNNGVYTYCLLNGLREKLADSNNDGIIMVSELQNYLAIEIPKLTSNLQRPTFRAENISNDWRIW